ncbi:MAG TPA: glycosyltransferase [Thermoanaerobaculia bacterium]|nr:glycosyltransferase [Thermoanaerobaculia bacterium]
MKSIPRRLDVLICCHNDAALLPGVLEGLANQTVTRDAFRVIVVDNASTDDLSSVIERFAQRLEIVYVHEPLLGLNRARNAGHAHATSKFVAHIDADTIPDPAWVESILAVVENVACDLCGGPYRPYYLTEKPAWMLDRFLSHDFGSEPKFLTGRQHPHGMNMVWKRDTVQRLGGFATTLGLTGRGLVRGDETELVARAKRQQREFAVYYHPGISVRTLARSEVLRFRYWIRRYFVHGRTCRAMWGKIGPGMSWPWPLRGAGAIAGIIATTAAAAFRDRAEYPLLRSYLFARTLPFLFHLGSSYQDLIDTITFAR